MSKSVAVHVAGLSGSRPNHYNGPGKSCLCYRFVYPSEDEKVLKHPSVLSLAEFQGDVLAGEHSVYWGSRTVAAPVKKKVKGKNEEVHIHVVEHSLFLEDVTLNPFRVSKRRELNYIENVLAGSIKPGKRAYKSSNYLDSSREVTATCPSNVASLPRGLLLVLDCSRFGCPREYFNRQLAELESILTQRKNMKGHRPDVALVLTKCDEMDEMRVPQIEKLTRQYKLDVFQSSADKKVNVTESFTCLATKVLNLANADPVVKKQVQSFVRGLKLNEKVIVTTRASFSTYLHKRVLDINMTYEVFEQEDVAKEAKFWLGKEEPKRMFLEYLVGMKVLELNSCGDLTEGSIQKYIGSHPSFQGSIDTITKIAMRLMAEEKSKEIGLPSISSPLHPSLSPYSPNEDSGFDTDSSTKMSTGLDSGHIADRSSSEDEESSMQPTTAGSTKTVTKQRFGSLTAPMQRSKLPKGGSLDAVFDGYTSAFSTSAILMSSPPQASKSNTLPRKSVTASETRGNGSVHLRKPLIPKPVSQSVSVVSEDSRMDFEDAYETLKELPAKTETDASSNSSLSFPNQQVSGIEGKSSTFIGSSTSSVGRLTSPLTARSGALPFSPSQVSIDSKGELNTPPGDDRGHSPSFPVCGTPKPVPLPTVPHSPQGITELYPDPFDSDEDPSTITDVYDHPVEPLQDEETVVKPVVTASQQPEVCNAGYSPEPPRKPKRSFRTAPPPPGACVLASSSSTSKQILSSLKGRSLPLSSSSPAGKMKLRKAHAVSSSPPPSVLGNDNLRENSPESPSQSADNNGINHMKSSGKKSEKISSMIKQIEASSPQLVRPRPVRKAPMPPSPKPVGADQPTSCNTPTSSSSVGSSPKTPPRCYTPLSSDSPVIPTRGYELSSHITTPTVLSPQSPLSEEQPEGEPEEVPVPARGYTREDVYSGGDLNKPVLVKNSNSDTAAVTPSLHTSTNQRRSSCEDDVTTLEKSMEDFIDRRPPMPLPTKGGGGDQQSSNAPLRSPGPTPQEVPPLSEPRPGKKQKYNQRPLPPTPWALGLSKSATIDIPVIGVYSDPDEVVPRSKITKQHSANSQEITNTRPRKAPIILPVSPLPSTFHPIHPPNKQRYTPVDDNISGTPPRLPPKKSKSFQVSSKPSSDGPLNSSGPIHVPSRSPELPSRGVTRMPSNHAQSSPPPGVNPPAFQPRAPGPSASKNSFQDPSSHLAPSMASTLPPGKDYSYVLNWSWVFPYSQGRIGGGISPLIAQVPPRFGNTLPPRGLHRTPPQQVNNNTNSDSDYEDMQGQVGVSVTIGNSSSSHHAQINLQHHSQRPLPVLENRGRVNTGSSTGSGYVQVEEPFGTKHLFGSFAAAGYVPMSRPDFAEQCKEMSDWGRPVCYPSMYYNVPHAPNAGNVMSMDLETSEYYNVRRFKYKHNLEHLGIDLPPPRPPRPNFVQPPPVPPRISTATTPPPQVPPKTLERSVPPPRPPRQSSVPPLSHQQAQFVPQTSPIAGRRTSLPLKQLPMQQEAFQRFEALPERTLGLSASLHGCPRPSHSSVRHQMSIDSHVGSHPTEPSQNHLPLPPRDIPRHGPYTVNPS